MRLRHAYVDARRWVACKLLGHKPVAYVPGASWCRRCGGDC